MRGSASTPLVATTGDEVLAALRAYDTATRAGDIDGQVAFFSESWRSSSGTTKADLREHLQKQIDRGGDEDKRLVLDDAKVAVEGDSASVDPVALRSPTGGGFFEFKMTREPDGVWRCDGEWRYVGDLFAHGVEGYRWKRTSRAPTSSSWAARTCSCASATGSAAATTSVNGETSSSIRKLTPR